MKPSFIRRPIGNKDLSRDRIGILLALGIGVTGLLIVFLLPDPLRILAPQIPVLTPQNWPGSQIGTEMFFLDGWQAWGTSASWSPFTWEEKRGFYQSLYLSGDNLNTSIDQTLVWYADPDENAYDWKQLPPDEYNGWPIIERSMDTDKPASILACHPGVPPQCWYLAYWEHWFTAVFFWRQEDEDLLLQDIHKLTTRVDQLLVSAPDEPCFWFLCTNGQEALNSQQK